MQERLLVTEFVEALQERANDRYKGKLARAFVDWYIEAEFGGVDWKFTDDSGDGASTRSCDFPEIDLQPYSSTRNFRSASVAPC